LGQLKLRTAGSGITLIVTDPNMDEIDSLYGSCLGVDAMSYAWQSTVCAGLVREHYRADYALFLSSDIVHATVETSVSWIDLRNGQIVWSNKARDSDWRDDRSARRAVENVFAGSPL
jgi:outer membrane protein assembly factor BamB